MVCWGGGENPGSRIRVSERSGKACFVISERTMNAVANFRSTGYTVVFEGVVDFLGTKAIKMLVPFKTFINIMDRPAVTNFVDSMDRVIFGSGSTIKEDPIGKIFEVYMFV